MTSIRKEVKILEIKFDTHTHTIASAHAYSTFYENAIYSSQIGMDGFAMTDHAPTMPDAPHEWHFANLKNIPREVFGQKILVGVELNILGLDGEIDLDESILKNLDVVNASIHGGLYKNNEAEDHTAAYEAVVTNPLVDIICHSGTPQYSYDYEYIIKLAKKHKKLIEINNHTFFVRKSSAENCRRIAQLCKENEVGIVVSSDAHVFTDIGDYSRAIAMLEEIGFPEELVMNTTYNRFAEFLEKERGKTPMRWTLQ